jgi:hypothetical protein
MIDSLAREILITSCLKAVKRTHTYRLAPSVKVATRLISEAFSLSLEVYVKSLIRKPESQRVVGLSEKDIEICRKLEIPPTTDFYPYAKGKFIFQMKPDCNGADLLQTSNRHVATKLSTLHSNYALVLPMLHKYIYQVLFLYLFILLSL